MIRCIRYKRSRLAENPIGQIVTWDVKDRVMLADVVGIYYREMPAGFMLRVRHFDGETMSDISASAVRLVLPDLSDYQSGDV